MLQSGYLKKYCISICWISIISIIACSDSDQVLRKKVIKLADEYVTGQLKTYAREVKEGVIIIGDENRKYYIDPSAVFTGDIDIDSKKDALITIVSYDGKYLGKIEHLIMININGRLMVQRSVESDMKILNLKDGLITAEVPTHPRSSPLFNCPECREVVTYRYVNGELVKTE